MAWTADTGTTVKVNKGDVVWSQMAGTNQQIFFSTFMSAQDTWSTPVQVTKDDYRNGHPALDAGTNGKKWLVWVAGKDTDSSIHYSVEANGAWAETAVVPSPLKVNVSPSVMVDGSGNTWVAWSGNDGGQDEIYCSRYIGQKWTTPVRVNTENDVPDILPEITMNSDNNPQITWYGYRNGSYVKLQSTFTGAAWSNEEVVEEASQNAMQQTGNQTGASIENMPSFIQRPDKAFVRVYKSSPVK